MRAKFILIAFLLTSLFASAQQLPTATVYGKVIDDDTMRVITVMLRYHPDHEGAVDPLREWVDRFNVK